MHFHGITDSGIQIKGIACLCAVAVHPDVTAFPANIFIKYHGVHQPVSGHGQNVSAGFGGGEVVVGACTRIQSQLHCFAQCKRKLLTDRDGAACFLAAGGGSRDGSRARAYQAQLSLGAVCIGNRNNAFVAADPSDGFAGIFGSKVHIDQHLVAYQTGHIPLDLKGFIVGSLHQEQLAVNGGLAPPVNGADQIGFARFSIKGLTLVFETSILPVVGKHLCCIVHTGAFIDIGIIAAHRIISNIAAALGRGEEEGFLLIVLQSEVLGFAGGNGFGSVTFGSCHGQARLDRG